MDLGRSEIRETMSNIGNYLARVCLTYARSTQSNSDHHMI